MLLRFGARMRRVVADGGDRGAAIAEFAMITVLLVFLLFAVLQVAVFFYVRNIVAASAADGARYAAGVDVQYASGAARATDEIRHGLTGGVAQDVPCQGGPGTDGDSGLPVAVVHCQGKVRSFFLPIGALLDIDVTSRALKEGVR